MGRRRQGRAPRQRTARVLLSVSASTEHAAAGPPPLGTDRHGAPPRATTSHIRGSSLMLLGRVISMATTFLAQVIVVRYLSKDDFGHFGYAWSVVLLLQSALALGLDRADTRFLSLYDERRDHVRFFGVLAVELVTIVATGLVAVAAVLAVAGLGGGPSVNVDPASLSLLAILVALAPLQALDQMTLNVFAVMARPGAIFVRRYVLEPSLRLLVIVLLVVGRKSVEFLALGYLAVGIIGLSLYGGLLVRLLRPRWVQYRLRLRQLRLPVRELFSFSLPLLSSNIVYVATTALATIVLGYFRAPSQVAAFRAVQPVATLNVMVMLSFAILFTPAAGRLWARDDRDGLRDLYWQTASWLAVLTFPVFTLTTGLAEPLTVKLFGARYAESATYLALLSLGFYANAAVGFNGITIQMLGRIRYVVVINCCAAAFALASDLVLIPRFGALGAAVAVLATLLLHNVLKQAGLRGTGVGVFDARYVRTYGTVVAGAAAVWLVQRVAQPPLAVGVIVAALVSLAVVRLNRRALRLAGTFPELARIPIVGRLVAE
jgi:O-antigen/teichoic acid export membrane protein